MAGKIVSILPEIFKQTLPDGWYYLGQMADSDLG